MSQDLLARRAVALGTLGAVATGARTAAAVGTAALLAGGNAVDAALAAALAETVLLPSKCGLAGDLVALLLPVGASAPRALTAIGPAAEGLVTHVERGGWDVLPTGGLAVGVPGAPAGYAALAAHSRLGLAAACRPATAMARRGTAWSAVSATLAAEADALLRRHQPEGCTYRPPDGPLAVGQRLATPGLARVLDGLAEHGAAVFDGPLGDRVVAAVQAHDGVLTRDDLGSATAEWAEPARTSAGGRTVWATPAPSYGPALLDVLDHVPSGGQPHPDTVAGALRRLHHGSLPTPTGGTSAVAAVDADGLAVVVVHSLSWPRFGAGIVVPGLDLVLGNRAGRGFTFEPGHPNAPARGRRPRTTLHAWGVADRQGRPRLLGATPGGEQQVPWNAQVLGHLLAGTAADDPARDAGPAIAEALCSPRWGLDADGAPVAEVPAWSARSSHAVVATATDRDDLTLAAADPRLDGLAVAA